MDTLQTLNSTPIGYAFAAILGLICGSFYNVCIVRIPNGESLMRSRSHCPKCKKPITWRWNIPVVSYLVLRGKCISCRQSISPQYPLVELVTSGMFLWLFSEFGFSIRFLAYGIFLSLLLIISVIDLYHRIIPDELSLSGLVLGFIFSFFVQDISWLDSLLGVLIGGGLFFLIAYSYEKLTKREGLGGGDIKLLGMIGSWLGVKSVLIVVLVSTAVGSLVGILFMWLSKKDLKAAIPFGPFLALGAVVYLFWGSSLDVYFFPQ